MQISQSVRPSVTRSRVGVTHHTGRTKPRRSLHLLHLIAFVTVALMLLPLGYLIIRAWDAGSDGLRYLLDARTLGVIGNSLQLAGAVMLSSTILGVLFAWLTTRTDLPYRRVWLIGGLLPLVIPSFIGATVYIAALGPRGLLQQVLEPIGITAIPSIYGFFGAWLVITLVTYPHVALPVRAALLNMDPALEETARSLGAGRWAAFWRVTLPQLRPALTTGILLTTLYTLSDFGAVALMRYNAFTRVIFLQYTSSFDRSRAAVLSLALVVLAMGLLILERRITAGKRNYRAGGSSTARQARPVALGLWRVPALLFCGLLITIGVLVPVGVLAVWLIQGMQAGLNPLTASLTRPVLNTVGVSGLAALTVGIIAIPLALLAVRTHAAHGLVNLAYLGNSLPGLVVALSLVFFASNYLPAIYQTLPVLIFGYSVRFLPLSIGATRSALTQANPRYEEAGRSLGLSPRQAALQITLPLVRPGILGGMALVFLNAMKELPATLLLAPTGFRTLTTQIWTAQNEGFYTQVGAPALLLIGASALSLYLILGHETGRKV